MNYQSLTINQNPVNRWGYYDNSHVCGNCNGDGCRVCIVAGLMELRGFGRERFPLSRTINECTPPKIGPSWKWQGQGGWTYPYRTTAHKLRRN
jgi:hypothetical protein